LLKFLYKGEVNIDVIVLVIYNKIIVS
jgi:hypothetical protein